MYEKEAIYESLLHQKADIARRQQAYSDQKAKLEVCSFCSVLFFFSKKLWSLQKDKVDKVQEEKQAEIDRFVQNETNVAGTRVASVG